MKLTIFLITIACLQVSAAAFSQNISLKQKNAPINHLLDQIQQQSGYEFFYDSDAIKLAGNVTIDLKNVTVQQALDEIFREKPFTYSIDDKTIVIKKKEESFLDKLDNKIKTALAIPITINGTVLDEQNKPMPGVTIRIKNTNTAIVTDEKGVFSISVLDGKTILVFSFIGYEPQEIRAGGIGNPGTIVLKTSINNLHEVVVNKGYYTEREDLSTGSVTKVSAKEIEEQPVSNVLAALQGRVPGLQITQNSGLPGGSFSVQIRGHNSISNGTAPLYVIDGVPYDSSLPGGLINNNLFGGSPLNYINPYDIESVEVLKDADATTIYGTRAANGAILITTKKGKAGTMKVSLNVNTGVTDPARVVKVLNTQQYLQMRHEAFKNDGATPGPGDHDINGDWDTTRYTNWSKVLTQNRAQYTNSNVDISGGNENTQYLIGAGYNNQTTGFPKLVPGDGVDQNASVHFNINTISPDKRFKLALTGSYTYDHNTVQSENFNADALTLPPDAPAIFNPDGSLNWAPLVPGQSGTFTNPYGRLYQKYQGITSNLVGNAMISYKLLKGLELKSNVGYTITQGDETNDTPTTVYDPGQHVTSGSALFNSNNSHSWIIEPQIDYRLQIGRGVLSTLVGASFQDKIFNGTYISSSGFTSDALLNAPQAASYTSVGKTNSQNKEEGIYGRFNYNWEDKYLFNLTGRRDGSSRFGPGKQFGNFGAVGAAWIFSKEDFVQKALPFLSFGKLRGSYGTTGNDQIGDYKYIQIYGSTYYSYQGAHGLYPLDSYNPNFAWEITKKLEGGIELGFLKDRITVEASFYRNRSNNELLNTPLSVVTGFPSIISNLPAVVQNSGKEFTLNTINIKTQNFVWSTSFNLSIARNKLLSFPDLANSPYASTLVIGQPVTILKFYTYKGVNETTGLYQFATAQGGTTLNPSYPGDELSTIDLTPKFYGGFQNNFTYKAFSLSMFFYFAKQTGQKFFAAYGALPGTMVNQPTEVLNRWQSPGDNKPFQQFSQNNYNAYNAFSYFQYSDYAFGDASYIRLKNVSIAWQMPKKWKSKMGVDNLSLYIHGENLLTITKYAGDPESQGTLTGPRKVFTMGLQITL